MIAIEPANALGTRLRELRVERGLSQRQLTRLIGLSAHSNLADYEAGRRLPPVDVTEACERALAVSPGELVALRAGAATERQADKAGPPARPRRTWRFVVAGLAVVVLAVGAWVVVTWRHGDAPAAPAVGLSACDTGAYVLDTAPIAAGAAISGARQSLAPGTPLGSISLRFSPACSLAWARFLPTTATVRTAAWVQLEVHRVQDGATTTIRLPQPIAAESDPLLTVAGCVYARAVIGFADGQTVAGQTGCFQRG